MSSRYERKQNSKLECRFGEVHRREQGFLSESTQSGLIWIDAVTSDAADQPMMGVFESEASISEDRVAAPVWQVRTNSTMFYTNFLLLLKLGRPVPRDLGRHCQGATKLCLSKHCRFHYWLVVMSGRNVIVAEPAPSCCVDVVRRAEDKQTSLIRLLNRLSMHAGS